MTEAIKLKTKAGRLTRYGLSCGYVELAERGTEKDLTRVCLYMENTFIEVSAYDRATGRREYVGELDVRSARRVFSKKCREYGLSMGDLK